MTNKESLAGGKARFQILTMSELMELPDLPWGEMAARDLEFVARLVRADQLDRAAWRLADLAAELRRKIVLRGWKKVIGVTVPTGRGARLPRFPKPSSKETHHG